MYRFVSLAAVALTVALVAAACGDSGGDGSSAATTAALDGTSSSSSSSTSTPTSGTDGSSTSSTTLPVIGRVTIGDIVDDIRVRMSDAPAFTLLCPPGGLVHAGNIFNCHATPADPEQDGFEVFILVADEAGHYQFQAGTGIPASVGQVAAPDATCQTLHDAGQPYFYAVAFWFSRGKAIAGSDDDANGHPCDTEYPPADVAAFWNGLLTVANVS